MARGILVGNRRVVHAVRGGGTRLGLVGLERSGHAPPSGDGNGFGTRYAEDFALLASLGLTHHRVSVKWARLEPEPGVHDLAAVRHYRDVLTAAHEAGVSPWVCLHHFTLPRWFLAAGGFVVESNRTEIWRRHVDFVADTFGDLVAGWQPINETNYYRELRTAGEAGHQVTTTRPRWPSSTRRCTWPTPRPPWARAHGGACLLDLRAVADRRPGRRRRHGFSGPSPVRLFLGPVDRALSGRGLAGAPTGPCRAARSCRLRRHDRLLVLRHDGNPCGANDTHPPDAPVSPLGYGIWAGGLGLVLDRINEELPTTPILVAEYGIGTDNDDARAQYLTHGLTIVHDAIARGVDVRGMFHWTAWTTTSGSTDTTSPSESSTATVLCVSALVLAREATV